MAWQIQMIEACLAVIHVILKRINSQGQQMNLHRREKKNVVLANTRNAVWLYKLFWFDVIGKRGLH